jgi:hypothetical protein
MLLMMKLVERAEVAKSFVRLAADLLTSSSRSRYASAKKVARAAAAAAVHVATNAGSRHREPEEQPEEQPGAQTS